jgi:hypothetical protein
MDLDLSNKVLIKAKQDIDENKLYKLWLTELQSMDKDNYMNFEQYKTNAKINQIEIKNKTVQKKKSFEELENEANKLIKLDKKGLLIIEREDMF